MSSRTVTLNNTIMYTAQGDFVETFEAGYVPAPQPQPPAVGPPSTYFSAPAPAAQAPAPAALDPSQIVAPAPAEATRGALGVAKHAATTDGEGLFIDGNVIRRVNPSGKTMVYGLVDADNSKIYFSPRPFPVMHVVNNNTIILYEGADRPGTMYKRV